jgi:N-acetylglucosamine-6-phosphate deacetylase
MPQVYTGATIFDGTRLQDGQALVVDDGRVTALLSEARATGDRIHLPGGVLAPGMIDLQVNGGGGVLFNDAPSVEGVRAIAAAHRRFGTTALLPTLISDEPAVI